ncbi:MAG: hypothetical protein JW809_01730 [Pirellulales bacterium]|nr:hypothetical protein [Pirellulales bacterium]
MGTLVGILLFGGSSTAAAVDGTASSTISATLKPDENVGVGFDWLPRNTKVVTIHLNPPGDWRIVTNETSSRVVDQSGDTIWERTHASPTQHTWKGCGFSKEDPKRVINARTYARFEGLLYRDGGGEGQKPSFKASIADVDIDVDSLGLHTSEHWPPLATTHACGGEDPGCRCGDYEDYIEDTDGGGLYLPASLISGTGAMPATVNNIANTSYKILRVDVKPSWAGAPNPGTIGQLTFVVSGDGVALYEISTGNKVTSPVSIPEGGFSEEYAILTNDDFDAAGSIKATFKWNSDLAGGPDTAVDYVRLAPIVFDLDTDSDNTGPVDRTPEEDALEDVDGNGVGQVGKRIFVNMDDDNKNGVVDANDEKKAYTDADLRDKDFAKIVLEGPGSPPAGYSLWLGADSGLKIWYDRRKTPLSACPKPPDGTSGSWYIWDVGSSGANHPHALFVEGVEIGEKEVFWRFVKPGGSANNPADVVARDTVEINVEKMVWPNQDPAVNWDKNESTNEWNGLELADGWFMSGSLCDIINGAIGFIRTEYPKKIADGKWQGAAEHASDAKLDLAKLCGGTWEDNVTVRIEVVFSYEQSPNISVGQYVDTTHPFNKEGFFHNSGVKIENLSEIQIYDTASLLDAIDNGHQGMIEGSSVTISDDPNHDIDQTGTVLLRHTGSGPNDWVAEKVSALISGIPYEWPGCTNKLADLRAAPKGGQAMTILVFREPDDEYTFTVTIDGQQKTYTNIKRGAAIDPGMLYLQSHWGSGVKFTTLKVRKP